MRLNIVDTGRGRKIVSIGTCRCRDTVLPKGEDRGALIAYSLDSHTPFKTRYSGWNSFTATRRYRLISIGHSLGMILMIRSRGGKHDSANYDERV